MLACAAYAYSVSRAECKVRCDACFLDSQGMLALKITSTIGPLKDFLYVPCWMSQMARFGNQYLRHKGVVGVPGVKKDGVGEVLFFWLGGFTWVVESR